MSKVIFDISMSLDGYITAANSRPEEPLGDGGEQHLHQWAFGSDERSRHCAANLPSATITFGLIVSI